MEVTTIKLADKWYCIKTCYYLENYFRVGDRLPDGEKENRHFALGGIIRDDQIDHAVIPGDDPRPTNKMVSDLIEKHGATVKDGLLTVKNPNGADISFKLDKRETRKEAFYACVELGKSNENGASNKSETTTKWPGENGEGAVDPFQGRKFSLMSPDEHENAKVQDITLAILLRFKKEVKYAGKKRADLIQMAIDLEAKQAGARAL